MGRGLLIWFIIMLVETFHGVLRGMFIEPRIGTAAAERVGWPVAAILVLAIAALLIRWTGIRGTASLLRLGAAWAALTVGFELLVGVLRGFDGQALLVALDPRSGTVAWSAVLMLLTPLLAARLRGLR
jgi:hypothetical protein